MEVLPVIVLGHDRTMMTVENIRSILTHLKYENIRFIIGSDRSSPGHIQALTYFLMSFRKPYEIIESPQNNPCPGAMMNLCFKKALEYSDVFLYVENDMIMHRDVDPTKYMKLLQVPGIGAVNFRYSSPQQNKYTAKTFEFEGSRFVMPFPTDPEQSIIASFGTNMYNRRYVEAMGDVKCGVSMGDAEIASFRKYNSFFANGAQPDCMVVFDESIYHSMMNDERGVFYHIGINCQHRPEVRWNPEFMPVQYHCLSDQQLDAAFRSIFQPQTRS